jgi:hypothetical protein
MLLWSITEEDIVHGLRERGLPVHSLDDLTGREIEYIREYADLVFTTAANQFLDVLEARIKRERGWEVEEDDTSGSG